MKAYVFPGQGAQFVGMGKDLYDNNEIARELFEKANEVLGFRITDLMFSGTEEDLRQTAVTQPAIFLHSVILAKTMGEEFKRAHAMQEACEARPGTMAAVLALPDDKVEEICAGIDDVVGAANYNCPGQVVISGTVEGIDAACAKMIEAGAKRALKLKVGGAFHSPLMQPAQDTLVEAIEKAEFRTPSCPVYQNVDGKPHTDPEEIKENLLRQLTAPVRWTYDVQAMIADGADEFIELGPGSVLQGLVKKIDRGVAASGRS